MKNLKLLILVFGILGLVSMFLPLTSDACGTTDSHFTPEPTRALASMIS